MKKLSQPAGPLNYAQALSAGERSEKPSTRDAEMSMVEPVTTQAIPATAMVLPSVAVGGRGRRSHRSPVSPSARTAGHKPRSRTASVAERAAAEMQTEAEKEQQETLPAAKPSVPMDFTSSAASLSHHRRNSSIQSELFPSGHSSLLPCHQNQTVYPYAYQSSPYFFVPQSYPGTAYNTGVAAYPPSHSAYAQRNMTGLSNPSNHPFNAVSSPPMTQTSGFPVMSSVSSQPWQQMNQHYFYQGGYDQTGFYQPIYGISPHSFMRPLSSYPSMPYSFSGQSFPPATSYPPTQPIQMSKSLSSASDCPSISALGTPALSETNAWSSHVSAEDSSTPTVLRPQKRVNAAVKIVNPKTNMEISISPTQSAFKTKEVIPSLTLDESDKDTPSLSVAQISEEVPIDSVVSEHQVQKEMIKDEEQRIEEKDLIPSQDSKSVVLCQEKYDIQEDHHQDLASIMVDQKQEETIEIDCEKEKEIVDQEEKLDNEQVETSKEEDIVKRMNEETNRTIETTQEKESIVEMIQNEENETVKVIQEEENPIEEQLEEMTIEQPIPQGPPLKCVENKDLEIMSSEVNSCPNDHNVIPIQDSDVTESLSKLSIHQKDTTEQPPSLPNEKHKHRNTPAPLDLSKTSKTSTRSVSLSVISLKNATFIKDLNAIVYPDGFKPPNKFLNVNSLPGKFKYDEEFLLQFQKVYKDKPDLNWDERVRDTIGDGADDKKSSKNILGGLCSRSVSRSIGVSMTSIPIGSFGLNKSTSSNKSLSNQNCQHINTQTQGSEHMPSNVSDESTTGSNIKLMSNNKAIPVSGMASNESNSPVISRFSLGSGNPVGSGFSMSGSGSPVTPRMSSKKGGSRRGAGLSQSESKTDKHDQKSGSNALPEHVAPLALSANRWQPKLKSQTIQPGEHMDPEMVQRKVKAALNKLTVDNFDRITDQILEIASQSKNETDGRTLRQIIQLTFEKATDEANFSSMYARFCRKMMETTSPEIRDEKLQLDKNGRPITGGVLFRKYLLNRCQENFERGWKANLPTTSNGESTTQEAEMLSDEYYVLVTAKRRGLGLIKFIGELFKLNMLTERIMHECIKKLLANVVDPDEEEIESLCKLLATIGKDLESTEKGHVHMNVYIERMDKIVKTSNLSNRIKFMVMDILDLRKTGWKSKNADKGPKTIAEIHEDIAKEKAEAEAIRLVNQSRGSKMDCGRMEKGNRSNVSVFGIPDWQTTKGLSSTDSKAGDLSRLGQIRTSIHGSFGPGGQLSSLRSLSESKKSELETQDIENELVHSSTIAVSTLSDHKDQNILLLSKDEHDCDTSTLPPASTVDTAIPPPSSPPTSSTSHSASDLAWTSSEAHSMTASLETSTAMAHDTMAS